MPFSGISSLDQALGGKIALIRGSLAVKRWRFLAGDAHGAEESDFPDQTWPEAEIPITWSSGATSAWLRRTLVPAAEIAGIGLAGTPLVLTIVLPIGARIYLDGRLAYEDDWWADTRGVPLPLTDRLQPGRPITIAIRTDRHDGFGALLTADLCYPRLEEHLAELELFHAQMTFTHLLQQAHSADPELVTAWNAALHCLSPEALHNNDWAAWQAGVEEARRALAPFAALAKEYTSFLVGHSHIDMNWLWTTAETIRVCKRDFASVDDLMSRYPGFMFSQSQAATYRFIETGDPQLFARIKERVREGRWDVTASTWVEGDLNMACGEALAHHLLYSQRYVRQHFGRTVQICWEPDTFGHPASMPQILANAGVKYYFCCRGGKGQPLFWWEGMDGSRVLTYVSPHGYNGYPTPRTIIAPVMDLARRHGMQIGFYVYGVGDHGGGPTARDIETAQAIDRAPYVPQVRLSDTLSFYARAEKEGANLPVIKGELNTVFEGCYTTHADIKLINRRLESLLVTGETVAALSHLLAGDTNRQPALAEAWRGLLFHQFHDILCGAGIGPTYREARDALAAVEAQVASEIQAALARLAGSLEVGAGPGPHLVVFNQLGWDRTDIVRLPLSQLTGPKPQSVADVQGRKYPVQILDDELLFVARQVPAFGFQVYRFLEEPADDALDSPEIKDDLTLENELLRFKVHPASGAIEWLWDKEHARWVTPPPPGHGAERKIETGTLNCLQIAYEQPHPMSAWNIGEITRIDNLISGASVRCVSRGPVCTAVDVTRKVLNSSVRQRLYLYRGLRRIDVDTEIQWNEQGGPDVDAPMLRVVCTPSLQNGRATFEIPFAALERPANGNEVPALRWADVSDGTYGLSLLNNGKYGYHAHYHTLGMTLVRSSYDPDPLPDKGLHRFTYSLYPHAGTWREAGSTQRAAELNQPLLWRTVEGGQAGTLKPGETLLACHSESVLVSALKLAEDQPQAGAQVIVRLYETQGRRSRAVIASARPIQRAEETNLIEDRKRTLPVFGGHQVRLSFKPHQIRTVRLWYSL